MWHWWRGRGVMELFGWRGSWQQRNYPLSSVQWSVTKQAWPPYSTVRLKTKCKIEKLDCWSFKYLIYECLYSILLSKFSDIRISGYFFTSGYPNIRISESDIRMFGYLGTSLPPSRLDHIPRYLVRPPSRLGLFFIKKIIIWNWNQWKTATNTRKWSIWFRRRMLPHGGAKD